MTPLELLVMLVILYWVARQLLSDGWNLLRGRGAAPRRGGGSGRYGVRGYFADRWSDAWETATSRRRAKAARRAAGESRFPRLTRARAALSGWYREQGGGREYHRRGNQVSEEIRPGALDRAWDRWEQRRAGRAARKAAGEPDGRRGRDVPDVTDPRVATPPPAPTGEPSRPAADHDPPPSSPRDDQDAHRVPLNTATADERRQGDTDPGAGTAPDRGEAAAPPSTHSHKEDNQMAEATGLTSSINYAGAQSQAAYGNVAEVEQWLASLQAHEVTGETIEAGRQAMEQYQAAGASMERAKAALQRHMQVKEAYDANQDAGDREFVTSE